MGAYSCHLNGMSSTNSPPNLLAELNKEKIPSLHPALRRSHNLNAIGPFAPMRLRLQLAITTWQCILNAMLSAA